MDVSKSAGGMAGTTGLVGASAAMLGFNRLSVWLTAREFRFATSRRLKVAGTVAIWAGFMAFYSIRL